MTKETNSLGMNLPTALREKLKEKSSPEISLDPQQEAIQQNLTNLNLSFAAQVRNFNIQMRVAIDHKQLFPQFAHQIADELIEIVQLLRDAIAKVQI